jgi:hypothetical protein
MNFTPETGDRVELLKIQNSRKPHQVMYLVWNREYKDFRTEGLKDLFGVKEIRITAPNVLQSLQEYAQVLSFLLESMSTAEELHLPYGYQDEFEVGGRKYRLDNEGEYRILNEIYGF